MDFRPRSSTGTAWGWGRSPTTSRPSCTASRRSTDAWILKLYREAAARRGWQLPDDSTLNVLFETAECARYACNLGDAALAASRGEWWGFPMMEEIERWFADLEPVLAADGAR